MSVEALAVAAIVEEGVGGLRKMYQAGVTAEDFVICEDEIKWVEERASLRKPINVRVFKRKFPDFEWLVPNERLQDLLGDLKSERVLMDLNSLVETLANEVDVDNAIEKAVAARDILGQITRLHAPTSDFLLVRDWKLHYEHVRQLRRLAGAGESQGIPTGMKWIDFHWDGLVNGRMIVVLGRPGEGKSYILSKFEAEAILNGYRVLKFSPEMNRHEHTCRLHTLLSADERVKKEVGLEHSFRNRALMKGVGFPMKKYKQFMEWLDGQDGEIILMTNTHRQMKMSPAFIESKIADIAPDLVLIDPIYKLKAVKSRKSRIEELSDISDAIQDFSDSFDIPVVVTNQAHRQGSHKDDAPHKDSSFNSDVPIQEADHVIGVKNISEERRLIVRCSKSRFGHDFRFEAKFYPNTGVLRETSEPSGSYFNGYDEDVDDEELREIVNRATGRVSAEDVAKELMSNGVADTMEEAMSLAEQAVKKGDS